MTTRVWRGPHAQDGTRVSQAGHETTRKKGEDWGPARRASGPCATQLVDWYHTVVSEEQKQIGVLVNQAAPMLENTLMDLLNNMGSRAQVTSLLAERFSLMRELPCTRWPFSGCVEVTTSRSLWGRNF